MIDQRKPGWRYTLGKALPVMHHILAAIPQRLRHEFAQAPPRDRLRLLWRVVVRWAVRAASMLNLSGGGAAPVLKQGSGEGRIEQYNAHLWAFRSYQPRPLRAPLTLLRAETQPLSHLALDHTLGWSDLIKGEVRVRIAPGDHLTMVKEPLVGQLAKALSDELDAAQ